MPRLILDPFQNRGYPCDMSHAAAMPYGTDQLIDADMARALHADACRDRALVAWAVLWDLPAYPERFAARLVTSTASPYTNPHKESPIRGHEARFIRDRKPTSMSDSFRGLVLPAAGGHAGWRPGRRCCRLGWFGQSGCRAIRRRWWRSGLRGRRR